MKNIKYFFIVVIFNLPVYLFSQDDSLVEYCRSFYIPDDSLENGFLENTEQLPYTTFYQGENNEGITPKEILYIEQFNRLYIYGSRGISIINPNSMISETTIYLTSYGQYFKTFSLLPHNSNRMVFDGDHYLYCLSDELHLVKLDLQANTIVNSQNLGFDGDQAINFSTLKYDFARNYIFLGLSINSATHFYRFDAADISIFNRNTYENTLIYDLEINQITPEVFISYRQWINDQFMYCFKVTNFEFNPISGFESLINHREIEYINDPQNNIHKAICFPYYDGTSNPTAFEIDGNTNEMGTFNLPFHQKMITSTEFESTEHIIYFSYCYDNDGIGKLNIINNQIEDILLQSASSYQADIEVNNSKIFLGKQHSLMVVNKNYPYSSTSLDYYNDLILRVTSSNEKVFAVNHENCSIEVLDANGNFLESKKLGGACLSGDYNTDYNKVFMYTALPLYDDFQRIHIINLNNSDHDIIDFEGNGMGWITGLVSDDSRNLIYVSIRTDSFETQNEIKIIDAETNNPLPESIILPENMVCKSIFLANDKLYCILEWHLSQITTVARVYIIDLSDPSHTFLLSPYYPPLEGGIKAWFDTDPSGNVYVSINDFGDPENGRVLKIDNLSNTIVFNYPATDPTYIAYDETNNKLLFTQYLSTAYLGIVDLELQHVDYLDLSDYFSCLIKPFIDIYKGKVCLFGHTGNVNIDTRLVWMDHNTYEIDETITVDPLAISCAYNAINGDIYTFYPKNESDNCLQNLGKIERNSYSMTFQSLANGHRSLLDADVFIANEIFFDKDNQFLFIPNYYFSDFYKVELDPDQLVLQPGVFNWISFPRLDRVGNGTVSSEDQLNNITPFPSYINTTHWLPLGQRTIDKVWDGDHYTGELDEVQSTLGYKLETNNPGVSVLPMTGTVLATETTMPLYADGLAIRTNWTGYFLPMVQSPFDAIGEEFLEHINMLKGQYWACTKKDPGHTKSSESIWACACQQGRVEIKYGDMIEIYPTEDIPEFHWHTGWMQQESEPKPPSLSFQYEEQAEYDALFIELDTLNLPEEIGAFAGDSCIGATKVLATDTMALICAYTEGFEGEEISFELLYPTKSARPRCRDYTVLNTTTGIREQRRIVAGENQPYFLVSLKSQENIPVEETAFNVNIRPNPAKDEFTVSYFTGQEVPVELSLINSLGLPVKSWQRGFQGAGNYSMTISTVGLPSGCYYLKVKAGSAVEIQKIIIIH